MHALVTGAAGFIGSHLAERLLEQGSQVTCVDSLTDNYDVERKRANLQKAREFGARIVYADLATAELEALTAGVDVVFHLAGQPGVRSSWGNNFRAHVRNNIDATQRLLEAVRGAPTVRRVVFASSSSVYGDASRFPTAENEFLQPISPYGVTKMAAERLCTVYGQAFGLPTVALRYFTVYGPRQRPDMAFTRFITGVLTDQKISVYGSGEQVRDFTYVADVVEATILAGGYQGAAGSVFNVAGGSNASVNKVLTILERLTGKTADVRRLEPAPGDVHRTGGDTARIRAALGWKPSTSLEDGIARQLSWIRDGLDAAP